VSYLVLFQYCIFVFVLLCFCVLFCALLVIMGAQHDGLFLSGSPLILYIYIHMCIFLVANKLCCCCSSFAAVVSDDTLSYKLSVFLPKVMKHLCHCASYFRCSFGQKYLVIYTQLFLALPILQFIHRHIYISNYCTYLAVQSDYTSNFYLEFYYAYLFLPCNIFVLKSSLPFLFKIIY